MIDQRNIRILIVARKDVLRDSLQTLLNAIFPNGSIDLADNESDIIEYILEKPFDLVIFYLYLPFDEQISFVRNVKRIWPFLPVVLVTEDQAQSRAALEVGVDQTILRGFAFDELTKVIKKLFPLYNDRIG